MKLAPTPDFARVRLDDFEIPTGRTFGRIYYARHPDALGYGKSPSRFSDPRRLKEDRRFGVLYLGVHFNVCFLEAVLRDARDGVVGDWPLDEVELDIRNYARIVTHEELRLVDLRGDSPVRMGVPSDVAKAARQSLARQWSVAFHEHPEKPDGIIYPSRLNGQTNLAIYDRAIRKLRVADTVPLRRAPGLAFALDHFRVSFGP